MPRRILQLGSALLVPLLLLTWGEFAVEIRMEYVGDPPWLDLDNLTAWPQD